MTDTRKDIPQLTLYNSLTRKKEPFTPSDPKRVTMYNCGPTVYSYAHIGNARAAVVADVLFRVLRHIYGEDHVVYARNITDVDDKIIASAKEQGVDISDITEKYARIYNEDLAALGCLPPTYQPKATDNIQEMADIIVTLLEKGIAYATPEGHVLFDVTKMEDYGKLSGRKLEDNQAGARIEVAGYKRNPGDFLLWKIKSDEEDLGWSPQNLEKHMAENWQKYANQPIALTPGRPGWHIECSAMVRSVLGETIDIHCGGIDLKFPHHENEIAQSECANEKEFARFWVHNEFLNMGSEKMSKSLGNVKLIHDLRKDWDGEVIRLALLKAHYRSELIWSEDLLKESKAQLDGWYKFIEMRSSQILNFQINKEHLSGGLFKSLQQDLGTPDFISRFVDWFKSESDDTALLQDFIDQGRPPPGMSDVLSLMIMTGRLLGLLQKDPEEWFKGDTSDDEEAEINALIAERDAAKAAAIAAKKAGDKAAMGEHFKRSDAIRDTLTEKGIVLEDGPDGTTWRRA